MTKVILRTFAIYEYQEKTGWFQEEGWLGSYPGINSVILHIRETLFIQEGQSSSRIVKAAL